MRQFNGSVCPKQAQWHRLFLILTLLPALLALVSCGGGGSSSTPAAPSLTISCTATAVVVNGTVQCTQNVLNLSSTLVTWEVSTGSGTPVAGGNSTLGTINTNGLYTAPTTQPTPSNVVTITAVSQAQTTLAATATIQINAATAISSIICLDSTQTANLNVTSGNSLACTATSSANTPIPVFWQVNGNPGGTAALGFISGQGNYVAPLVPPPGGTVTIKAISQAVSTQTLTAIVNVAFGNKVMSGSYAFSTHGRLQVTNAFFARAGSFLADGNGGLTGLEDVNPQPGTITSEPISFSGTYSIGPDGRGIMQFCEPATGNVCAVPTSFFRVAVDSPQQIEIIDFQAGSAASGQIVAQTDTSVFNVAGLNGGYTFSFSGISSGSDASVVGEFVSDGKGNITSGELDTNTGGTLGTQVPIINTVANPSTYTVNSRGRGIAAIATASKTFNFAFYMVSASRAIFLGTDVSPILVGDSFKQQSLAPWGPSALKGAVVFRTFGTNSAGFVADVGAFTTDGTASITAGLLDENSGGAITSAAPVTGAYAIDVMGRGTITFASPSHAYVIYMVSVGSAVVQETTAATVGRGFLTQPQGGPFTTASLGGSYALNLAGQNAAQRKEDVIGQLSADGTGKITGGALDINNFGTLATGQANQGTYTTVDANGRTTMLLSPTRNLVLYFVSPTQLYALDTDASDVAVGSLDKQF